jgi:hypothetical protein
MPIIRLDLDRETFARLADFAIEECRPIPWQAEVLLKRALGMPTPCPGPCAVAAAVEAESEGAPHVHQR